MLKNSSSSNQIISITGNDKQKLMTADSSDKRAKSVVINCDNLKIKIKES